MKNLQELLEQAVEDKNIKALSHLKDFAIHMQNYEIAANVRDHIKKLTPLFTSEDGIDIFEGDEFTLVVFYEGKWFRYKRFKTTKYVEPKNEDLKKFADDLKALEWIEAQKPKIIEVEGKLGYIALVEKGFVTWKDENIPRKITQETVGNILKAMEELQNA